MNRDEIMAMKPGVELDKLVAKHVMGWEETDHPNVYKKGSWLYALNGYQFSTDIAAAWEIIEKLKNDGCAVSIGFDCRIFEKKWIVLIQHLLNSDKYLCESETAPEAICKAALLAKEAR